MMTSPKISQREKSEGLRKREVDQSAKDRQYQKFVDKARELETDESEENFDRVLKKVVKASPQNADRAKPSK